MCMCVCLNPGIKSVCVCICVLGLVCVDSCHKMISFHCSLLSVSSVKAQTTVFVWVCVCVCVIYFFDFPSLIHTMLGFFIWGSMVWVMRISLSFFGTLLC